MILNNGFCELSADEMEFVDGGVDWYSIGMGLSMTAGGFIGGALAGAILGGTAGLIGAVGYGVVKGNLSGGTIYRAYGIGALSGAAIGTYTPA